MAGNADVQVGDVLHHLAASTASTRPGCAVATVAKVDRKVDSGFARIALAPAAPPDGVRHVLVLEPTGVQLPPRPEAGAGRRRKPAKQGGAGATARGPAHDHAARAPTSCCCRSTRCSSGRSLLRRVRCSTWCRSAGMPAMPDFLALVLVFWNVHQPRRVGVGVAFVLRPADGRAQRRACSASMRSPTRC